MAMMRFFHPLTHEQVWDASFDLLNDSYQEAPYGSVDGTIKLGVNSYNQEFLRSVRQLSHFLEITPDNGPPDQAMLVPAFVKDAYIDKGVCYIEVGGFLEWMDMVPMIPSHKALLIDPSTTVLKEDHSWEKTIYAENNLGLFWEAMRNLQETMVAQGFTPPFNMEGVAEQIASGGDTEDWLKSYRINGLEVPKMSDILSDLTRDTDFLPVRVNSDTSTPLFRWKITVINSYNLIEINEAVDKVFGVGIDRGDNVVRSMSLAAGTDTKDNSLISRINFLGDTAYSAVFPDRAAKSTLDIARTNLAQMAGSEKRKDQLTFTTWDPNLVIFSAIKIYGKNLEPTTAVITQKSIEGQQVTYTATIVTDVSDMIPGVDKPTSVARRLIYDPAKLANRRSIRQSLQKQNTTGWR
jgi:hypothetical protein